MNTLLIKINDLYGVSISSHEKVSKGFLSENYFLGDGQRKFFLKKYRFENPQRIAEVHASKKYFFDGGIPVIMPIATREGDTFFSLEGSNYALFPFVEGREIERGKLSDRAIVSLAKMLGRIHILGRQARLEINDKFKIENKEKVLKKAADILAEIGKKGTLDEFDETALKDIKLKQKLLGATTLTMEDLGMNCDHLIHGDYLDHNVFFDENDEVAYVFDFEKTQYAPRTFELFRSMIYSLFNGQISEKDVANTKKYLEAYASVYPISADEIKKGLQLFLMKKAHGLWVEGEHYLNNNTRVDKFLFDDYERVLYLSAHLDELTEILIT